MKKIIFLFCLFFVLNSFLFSHENNNFEKYGIIIKTELKNSLFPHPKRMNGYTYDDKKYSFEEHYNDSSVLIFIPSYFKPSSKTDFVIHFHGWRNTVDSVPVQFNLIEQFYKSRKNAIYIIPQGPKNAPDSFGGKLEEKDGLKKYLSEITAHLKKKNIIRNQTVGNILVSGHSGAFRVISFILQKSGLINNIKEVYLFDALYGQTEKYGHWVDHFNGKLINIYTNDGGTKDETEKFIDDLRDWGIKFLSKEESEVTPEDLLKNRLIFIHSQLEHNQVLYKNDNFYNYLKASCLK